MSEQVLAGLAKLKKQCIVEKLTCCICGDSLIQFFFKCSHCKDTFLCETCFIFKKIAGQHQVSHPMIFYEQLQEWKVHKHDSRREPKTGVHLGIPCSVCLAEIQGIRFKCCVQAQIDICLSCFNDFGHNQSHPLLIYTQPIERIFDCSMFEEGQRVGQGKFGYVCRAVHKESNKVYAKKSMIKINQTTKNTFLNEIKAMHEFHCSSLVTYRGYSENERGLHIFMDWIEGKTLQRVIIQGKVTLRKRLTFAISIIRALMVLHAKNYVHKDVKPDNILISARDSTARLGDMGVSGDLQCVDRLAPILWSAPEISDRKRKITTSVDIYSFGLLLNFIFTGQIHTFKDSSGSRLIRKLEMIQSPFFFQLITSCLNQNPQKRPATVDIFNYLTAFQDRFFLALKKENKFNHYKASSDQEKSQEFIKRYLQVKARCSYLLSPKVQSITWFMKLNYSWGLEKDYVDALQLTFKQETTISGILFGKITNQYLKGILQLRFDNEIKLDQQFEIKRIEFKGWDYVILYFG